MKCLICNTERMDLSQHIVKEHNMLVKDYKRKFSVDSVIDKSLRNKRKIKTDKNHPFKCNHCPKKFKTQEALNRHYKRRCDIKHNYEIFNELNKDDWVECKLCGLRRSLLSNHIRQVHKIDLKMYDGNLYSKNHLINIKKNGQSIKNIEGFNTKEKNPFYGKKHSKQTKEQISKSIKADNARRDKHFNLGRKHTEEAKRNMSLNRTGERNGMFGKPAAKGSSRAIQGARKDIGHHVRSTFEANYIRYLKYNDVRYEYEPRSFVMVKEDGRKTSYRPDFYLPETDEYVETKNYKRKGIDKVALMQSQYQHIKIRVLYYSSDEWKEIDVKYRQLIPLWETGKQNLRKTPELY